MHFLRYIKLCFYHTNVQNDLCKYGCINLLTNYLNYQCRKLPAVSRNNADGSSETESKQYSLRP